MSEDAPRSEPLPEGRSVLGGLAGLRARLDAAFTRLDEALVVPAALAERRPSPDRWSQAEIAEHVVLTDHHLLLLSGKLARKARDRAGRGEPIPRAFPSFERLEALAETEFSWSAPEHLVPRGALALPMARRELRHDRDRCLAILASLPPGAGALASARFTPLEVHLDVHQFLALVAVHAERHARQARSVRELLESSG